MKVYVTKYALTIGILLMEVSETSVSKVVYLSGTRIVFQKHEWFESESEAIKDAEQRKEKKLIQLQNQLAKLEKKNVNIIKEV